ncbi:MAG: ProQ/FINO family protein, partial [Rhodopila sp.]
MAGRIQPLQQQSLSPAPAPDPPTAAAPITPDRKSEAQHAYREARIAIALLQQRWPAAFPEAPQQIRPLITGLTPLIAAALDWSHPYTRAVLRTWKLRPAYCHAVLAHSVRFDLEGNPTDQPVDEDARTRAKIRLTTWAIKRRQPAPHNPPGGGGTTASSSIQAPDHRKPVDSATASASRGLSRDWGSGCGSH